MSLSMKALHLKYLSTSSCPVLDAIMKNKTRQRQHKQTNEQRNKQKQRKKHVVLT